MDPSTIASAVSAWWPAHDLPALELPDGWFGRPFDSGHELTDVRFDDAAVSLELDGRHLITAWGAMELDVTPTSLRIFSFRQATFATRSYGDDRPTERIYAGGSFTFRLPRSS